MDNPTRAGIYLVKVNEGDRRFELGLFNGKIWEMPGEQFWRRFGKVHEWSEHHIETSDLPNPKTDCIPADTRVELATRTESPINEEVLKRFQNPKALRLLHAVMGLATEGAGEMMDNLKKHFFYGKAIDEVNLMEEMGDCDWYLNLACSVLETTMAVISIANVKKLAKRYGDKFSPDAALLRDLGAELEVLNENLKK